jgi:DNA-binding MarR family transcriptional regulator
MREGRGGVSEPGDVTLLYLIKQVELAVRSRLDEVAAEFGLTSLQYTALTVLQRRPGMTSAELARNSFVRAQTMAQMTNYLEGKRLIRREPDPASKRQLLLFLTATGDAAVKSLRGPVARIEEALIEQLTAAQVREFRSALLAGRESLGGSSAR